MNARDLRAEISREATRLARIQALAELAAAGAESSADGSINGGVVDVRCALEGLAELAHASWYRLSVLSEEPERPATPPRPRKRQPTLQVVSKTEAA